MGTVPTHLIRRSVKGISPETDWYEMNRDSSAFLFPTGNWHERPAQSRTHRATVNVLSFQCHCMLPADFFALLFNNEPTMADPKSNNWPIVP